jgi:hypothetical protein
MLPASDHRDTSGGDHTEDRKNAGRSAESDERWQRINLNLHLDEVVVEVKHGGHGKQADISADSKDCGLAP